VWRLDILGEETRREQAGRESNWFPHGFIVPFRVPARGMLKVNIGLFKT
jgi:hypothetical protein